MFYLSYRHISIEHYVNLHLLSISCWAVLYHSAATNVASILLGVYSYCTLPFCNVVWHLVCCRLYTFMYSFIVYYNMTRRVAPLRGANYGRKRII